jgi:hypothetical protein
MVHSRGPRDICHRIRRKPIRSLRPARHSLGISINVPRRIGERVGFDEKRPPASTYSLHSPSHTLHPPAVPVMCNSCSADHPKSASARLRSTRTAQWGWLLSHHRLADGLEFTKVTSSLWVSDSCQCPSSRSRRLDVFPEQNVVLPGRTERLQV